MCPPASDQRLRLALAGLCLVGWGGLAAMAAEQASRGALAPFGPGMGLIDGLRLWLWGDIRVWMDAGSLCSYDAPRPVLALMAEISAIRAAMTMAMVLPLLGRGRGAGGGWPGRSLRSWVGCTAALLAFCGLAAIAQIAAQAAGLLAPSLRIEGLGAQGMIIIASLLCHYLQNARPPRARLSDGIAAGFAETLQGIGRCAPMLLLMLPLGLMNLVAMAAMLAIHLSGATTLSVFRPLARIPIRSASARRGPR